MYWLFLFTCVVFITGSKKHSREVPAVRRTGRLGFFYNHQTSAITHPGIFRSELPESCLWRENFTKTVYSSKILRSSYDTTTGIGLEASAQLSALAGTLFMDASTRFGSFDERKSSSVQGVITATITTSETGFHPDCQELRPLYVLDRMVGNAHSDIVTAIYSGYRFSIFFEESISHLTTRSEVEARLETDISRLSAMLTSNTHMSISGALAKKELSFSVMIQGDVDPPAHILLTFADIVKYVQQTVKSLSLKPITMYGGALSYSVTPLESFAFLNKKITSNRVIDAGNDAAEQYCIEKFRHFEESKLLLQQAYINLAQCGECRGEESTLVLEEFQQCFAKQYVVFKADVKRAMKKKHVQGRSDALLRICGKIGKLSCGPDQAKLFVDFELKPYMELVEIVKRFRDYGIGCMKGNVKDEELFVKFFNKPIVLLSFKLSELQFHVDSWNDLSREFIFFCTQGFNISCKIVNCETEDVLCPISKPVIIIIEDNFFREYESLPVNLTYVLKYIRPIDGPKFIANELCIWVHNYATHKAFETLSSYFKFNIWFIGSEVSNSWTLAFRDYIYSYYTRINKVLHYDYPWTWELNADDLDE